MTNPGSSILTALGAGSGINFAQLAENLSEASFGVKRETIEDRTARLEAQISAASVLRSSLTSLAGALGDRIRAGDVAPRASISNPDIAQVQIPPGTAPSGSYELEVEQLADAQTLVLGSFASAQDNVGEGTLRIRFGMVSAANFSEDTQQSALDIEVLAGDTPGDVASKIGEASGGALRAYVANGTGGAQLVIKGRDGEANGFTLEDTGGGSLAALAWSPASDAGELRSTARDAIFSFDTVAMRSAGNSVSGLPEGITLDLSATNIGSPATIAFSQNTAAITGVMSDFTAALNDIVALVNGTADGSDTSLASDPGARELRRDLARLTSEIVLPGAPADAPSRLSDLGLSLNRDGSFRLDSERLAQTLADDPQGAAAMFTTGPTGIFATIDRFARNNTSSGDPGSLGGSLARLQAQVERNDERLTRIAEQQDNLRERLTRDLAAAESRIASSQSTLDFIRQQFEISDD